MDSKDILKEIEKDFEMLEKIEILPRKLRNTKELRETLTSIFKESKVWINTNHRRFGVRGSVSDVWGDYEWAEGRKYLIIKNIRLLTSSPPFRAGVPHRGTASLCHRSPARLVSSGRVRAPL